MARVKIINIDSTWWCDFVFCGFGWEIMKVLLWDYVKLCGRVKKQKNEKNFCTLNFCPWGNFLRKSRKILKNFFGNFIKKFFFGKFIKKNWKIFWKFISKIFLQKFWKIFRKIMKKKDFENLLTNFGGFNFFFWKNFASTFPFPLIILLKSNFYELIRIHLKKAHNFWILLPLNFLFTHDPNTLTSHETLLSFLLLLKLR